MLVTQALCGLAESQDPQDACKMHFKISSMLPQFPQSPKGYLDKQQGGCIHFEPLSVWLPVWCNGKYLEHYANQMEVSQVSTR